MKVTVSFSIWKKLEMIAEDEEERRVDRAFVMSKWIRGGKCSEEYNDWQKCSFKCDDLKVAFAKCCATHKDYYWPMLGSLEEFNDFWEQLRIKHLKEREQFFKDLKRD